MPPVLELKAVTKLFGDFVAVDEVDLEIEEGEFITLLGPSGCGKTTVLRMIAGFEVPTRGSIVLDGTDITAIPAERRPFNMVFQSYALFPHMSVYDNVAYGLRTHGMSESDVSHRVMDALETVGLEERAGAPPSELSGGQRQRVALVRALVNEPRVLLLDEPLGALDLQLRKRMQEELRALQHRVNTTFVYVTHDQEEALVMSHRVVLMRSGRMVQIGTPGEVYGRPKSRFVGEFVGETNMIPCTVVSQDGGIARIRFVSGVARQFPYFGEDLLAEGEGALVSLRPQHLTVVAAGEGEFEGRVLDTVLLGAISIHEVVTEGGQQIRVMAGEGDQADSDSLVGVSIREGRGVVVRAEESAVDPDVDTTTWLV